MFVDADLGPLGEQVVADVSKGLVGLDHLPVALSHRVQLSDHVAPPLLGLVARLGAVGVAVVGNGRRRLPVFVAQAEQGMAEFVRNRGHVPLWGLTTEPRRGAGEGHLAVVVALNGPLDLMQGIGRGV